VSRFVEEAGFDISLSLAGRGRDGVGRKKQNGLIKDLKALKDKKAPVTECRYKLPEKFSFSQLEAFSNCPLQYKFNFILKIPVEDKVSFIFGRVMHNALRDALAPLMINSAMQQSLFSGAGSEIKKPTLQDFYATYERHWQDDGYHSKKEREDYKKKGKNILKELHSQMEHSGWPQVMFMEKNFNLKMNGYILKGGIDRIDRVEGEKVEIIDYKTGKPKEKLAFDDKRQLILYQIAVTEAFGLKVAKLTYYYLENGQAVSFEAKEKDVEKVKEQIVQGIGEIIKCNFIPKPGFLCSYCDFNNICEFRK